MITASVHVRDLRSGEQIIVSEIGDTLTEIGDNVARACASLYGWRRVEVRVSLFTLRNADTADLDDALDTAFRSAFDILADVDATIVEV